MSNVCVIGGGVIGACAALELADAGCSVTIVDRGTLGGACSHGNCGYICPSHALPLTQPGVVWENAFKALLPSSALYVKPSLSPALLGWMWKFMRRCNRRDMLAAADGLHALLHSSRALYDELLEREGIDCDFEAGGLLFVYETAAAHAKFADTADMLGDRYGLATERIEKGTLLEREPALREDSVAGAWAFPNDAHLRPERLMAGMRASLERRGMTLRENTGVTGFEQTNGFVRRVTTDAGPIDTDHVVVATGATTPLLAKHFDFGAKIPIQPGKGYSYTTDRPEHCPRAPMIFEEKHVAVTPWKSGYRVGSTMEFSGYDTRLNPKRLANLRRVSGHYLKDSAEQPTLETWYGWRPMTPDSLPMIGRIPNADNVLLATGHNMLGLSLATGTGRLVRELMLGEQPHVDPAPYDPTRFS